MIKIMKKLITLCLVLLFCLSTILGCVPSESTSETSGASSGSGELVPHLEKRDLDGFVLTFFTYENPDLYNVEQLNTDEQDSEPVNSAFYKRNREIEAEYNCKIQVMIGNSWLEFPQQVRQLVNVGDDSFNVLVETLINTAMYSQEEMLTSLFDLSNSHLNLEGEWWDQGLIDQCSINNKLDFITGDLAVTDNDSTYAILFNKDIATENNLESPYELVKQNKWTFDKMVEMAKAVVREDGDSQMTVTGNDVWGMIALPQSVMAFLSGFGSVGATKDKDDLPILEVKNTDFVNGYQKIYSFLCDETVTAMDRYYYSWDDPDLIIVHNNFPSGKSLFTAISTIGYISSPEMRDSEVNYGILPYPKLNEQQAEYLSPMSVYGNGFFSIPNSVQASEHENITYILEAMSYLGKEKVLDEYYQRTLKRKRANDTESAEMLDIIFKNRIYDLSVIFGWGGIYYENSFNVLAKVDTIVSRIDAIYEMMDTERLKTIENFTE